MKRLALILSLGLSSLMFAQTVEDVELFHHRDLNGSPRFTAMGGAFTALGNDPSAIGINPASGAVNNHSNLSFALGVANQYSSYADFYGEDGTKADLNFSFENFGLNLNFGNDPKNRYSLAISINRIADFNMDYNSIGNPNSYTLGQYWAESSAGVNVDNISDDAFAAWDAYILVSDANRNILGDGTGFAYGDSIDGNLVANSEMNYVFNQNGGATETNIALAMERRGKIYYGISIGIPNVNFRREEFITENILNVSAAPYSANQYTYRRLNDLTGTGLNFKLGFIYAPFPALRIGASYQSNTFYTINQFYETDVVANFVTEPFAGVGTSTASAILESGQYSYRLRTPSVLRLGVASVLSQSLVLSVDYQYQNANNNRLYTNNASFNIDENFLRTEFQPVVDEFYRNGRQTIAAGLEWKLGNLFIRGGYRLDHSMYKEEFQDFTRGDRRDISGGIGYQKGPLSVSLTGISSAYSSTQVLYRGFDPQTGDAIEVLEDLDFDNEVLRLIAGVTYKF